jgi:superfamily II DNA or RNA helicase
MNDLFRPVRRVKRIQAKLGRAISIPLQSLTPDRRTRLKALFTYENPEYSKLRRLGFWAGKVAKTISTWTEDEEFLHLPRGGLDKIRPVILIESEDQRLELDPVEFEPTDSAELIQLRDDQEAMVQAVLGRETCLVRAATGSGKSEVAVEVMKRVQQPTLVVVWSSGLQTQWVRRIAKRLGIREGEVGTIGGGKSRVRAVTVAMQQTLYRNPEAFAGAFGCVICDEVQRFSARTFREVISQFPARYRVGFSADERRKDGLEMLVHDLFGEVAIEIGRKELIERGDLCDVEIVAVPTDFLVPEIEEAPREERGRLIGSMWGQIIDRLASDPWRNNKIAETASREACDGKSVLVFTDRVEHARELSRRIAVDYATPCGLAIGGVENRDNLESTVKRLDKGTLKVAVATSCLYQGTDIPRLSVGIVATPTGNNRQLLEQQIGRLRRTFPGKRLGRLYYIWDERIFPRHVENFRRWYGDKLVRVSDSLID